MSLLTRRGKPTTLNLGIKPRTLHDGPQLKTIQRLADGQKIFDIYTWREVLQESGDGGKVVVCQPKDCPNSPVSGKPNDKYVMKIRSKKSLREKRLEETFRKVQERTLNLPPHEGVIPIIDVFEDNDFYFVVMEKADGGSFFEGLLAEFSSGIIPSSEIKRLTSEILKAVGHVHSQGMLHRDIKPDNFVMEVRDEPSSPTGKQVSPKLVDFDHACPDWGNPQVQEAGGGRWGTLSFNAPETFLSECSEQSDLYSVGACLYLLMTGTMPYPDCIFEQGSMEDMYHALKKHEVDWQCDPWPDQPLCKELCQSLLAFNPKERVPSWDDALKARWFQED
mmetsp:Transcript_58128/g.149647  ORF Transcript_58128/g.149647 Transcript_58128/m.149647 type:complete len:335 (+) Transcript_58128:80-1084(+)|eukprot:CAMPEP_0195077408 /NCGR_PEP_ID=MMETSP0448-20130528/19836_1 /TAXON_ID=66468 /ORGANISM="Heterocapsa triquestra, Strain CCMP 448" /LENGTH=334 /DNA_ID=CAMNT_0040110041 /DNA_START=84 /DNA_END=1088 /DNA_ORIENTATION=-